MNKIIHPMEAEELMAYLDGELSKSRAAVAAAHLGECAECKEMVEGLRRVSQEMRAWELEVPERGSGQVRVAGVEMPFAIADALGKRRGTAMVGVKHRWRQLFGIHGSRLAWAGGVAGVIVVLAVSVNLISRNGDTVFSQVGSALNDDRLPQAVRPKETVGLVAPAARPAGPPHALPGRGRRETARAQATSEMSSSLENRPSDRADERGGGGTANELSNLQGSLPTANGPMIIRTADLKLTTKELDKARARIEGILKQHHGYVGDLAEGDAAGGARTLTATLRVPADQLDSVVSELKALGHVDSESQGGQDVTSQYVDLKARQANAQNTEKRLTDLLNQRTGKLSDVLQVEQELDRVRGEIEQMEAQRKTMANQISFATLSLTVSEEYKAQLEAVPPTTGTRLRNSAVEGYRSMVDGVVSVVLFLLSSGPSLLLWAAVLFFPARGAWRMMRRRWAA